MTFLEIENSLLSAPAEFQQHIKLFVKQHVLLDKISI